MGVSMVGGGLQEPRNEKKPEERVDELLDWGFEDCLYKRS